MWISLERFAGRNVIAKEGEVVVVAVASPDCIHRISYVVVPIVLFEEILECEIKRPPDIPKDEMIKIIRFIF